YLSQSICHKPLEPLNQPIHKLNSLRRAPKPSSKPPDKPEHMNPEPVATRCGHIFHKGCIKKMISEQASCRISCPACNRPVVLAQLRLIRFFYPPKCESLSRKIDKMNLENDVLAQQLEEVRKLRQRRKYEQDVVKGKIQELNHKVRLKQESLAEKQEKIKTMQFNGQSVEEIEESVTNLKERISTMSRNNACLLKQLEFVMANMNCWELLPKNLNILQELRRYFAVRSEEDTPNKMDLAQYNEHQQYPSMLRADGDPLSSLMDELVGTRLKISSAIDIVQENYNNNKLSQFQCPENPDSHNIPALMNSKSRPQLLPNMAGDDYRACLLAKNLNNFQIHHNQAQFLNWVDSSLLHQNLHLMHGRPFMNCADWRCNAERPNQPWNTQLVKCTPNTGFSLNTESNVSFGKVVMLPPVVPSQTFPSGMAEFVLDVTRQKQRKSENHVKKHKVKLGKCVKKNFKQ
ncbi:unnamed protein product, partial [Allacma fusca]